MKKDNTKSINKIARKTATKTIFTALVDQLKTATAKFGEGTKDLEEEIEKGAKKLAKKIVKQLKFQAPPKAETAAEPKDPKAVAPEKKSAAVNPIRKKSDVKKKAAPAKS